MNILAPLLLIGFAGSALADCSPDDERWIALELVASEPAGGEPVEVIDIDRAGCATIRYASFDVRAGLYRRKLEAGEVAQLQSTVAQHDLLAFDEEQVRAAISRNESRMRLSLVPGASEYFSVQCGDTYRLSIAQAGETVAIEWYAPMQIAQRHPDVAALAGLTELIALLRKAAAAPKRVRVAEIAP